MKRLGRKQIMSLALAIVMVLALLSGCGGGSRLDGTKTFAGDNTITGATASDSAGFMDSFVDGFSALQESVVENTTSIAMGDAKAEFEDGYYVEHNTEEYSDITENRFLAVQNNPLSTFAADVDTASYSNFRRYINDGELPPADAVRIEEMVNYFKYDYPEPENGEPFSCTTEVVECSWNDGTLLLSVGLATESVDSEEIPAQNLVFLIDVSGSMTDDLELVKRSFLLLCDQLKSEDTISIVTYASNDEVVLDGASGDEIDLIMQAIENLSSGGSTNGSDGIITAYEIAEEHFIEGGNNRIILATDGDLNIGITSEGELEDLVADKRKTGVYLSVLGFGYGNYKDNKLEALADNGNGNLSYIDSILEARKALIEDMGGTLLTVAKDVKLQVEFNPATVKGYRLIGYENRLLAAEDFADDTVDGGELGAGHRVTALYEVVPIDSDMDIDGVDLKYQDNKSTEESTQNDAELCTVSVRCKAPNSNTSNLWEYPVLNEVSDAMSDNLALASAVAQVGMLLRESEYSGTATYESVLEQLDQLDEKDALVEEFEYLTSKASRLGGLFNW